MIVVPLIQGVTVINLAINLVGALNSIGDTLTTIVASIFGR